MFQTNLRVPSRLLVAASLSVCTMVALNPTSAAESGKKTARYVKLINCGANVINITRLQKKSSDNKKYHPVLREMGLNVGVSVCFDLNEVNGFETGDMARLRSELGWGDRINCDSTKVDLDGDQVRIMKISGTTLNNNRSKSKKYRNARASDQCHGTGGRQRHAC